MLSASYLGTGREPVPGYRLLGLLGRGGASSVWEATKPDGGKIALKFMTCGDGQAASAEIRSIQAVRELRHSNLIRVHQVWCQRKHLVISMELADGTLLELRKRHKLEPGQLLDAKLACGAMVPAANVLDFLNAKQHLAGGRKVAYQHVGVKATNFLLFGNTIKLTDFGLVTQATAPAPAHRRPGNPPHVAPEVLQGRLSDTTDQYGLAVTYYELRTGRPPFAQTGGVQGLTTTLTPRSDPDLSLLDPAEQAVLTRALSRLPQDRWPTCREFANQLARVAV